MGQKEEKRAWCHGSRVTTPKFRGFCSHYSQKHAVIIVNLNPVWRCRFPWGVILYKKHTGLWSEKHIPMPICTTISRSGCSKIKSPRATYYLSLRPRPQPCWQNPAILPFDPAEWQAKWLNGITVGKIWQNFMHETQFCANCHPK
jgi:hypothetical protein